jgi:hypothetical protein
MGVHIGAPRERDSSGRTARTAALQRGRTMLRLARREARSGSPKPTRANFPKNKKNA